MNTFDFIDLSLLPDLDSAEVYELKVGGIKTKSFCKKCNINWVSLDSQSEGDEVYDFCPFCKNDLDLAAPIENQPLYLFCPITGNIINVETKEVVNKYSGNQSNYNPAKILTEEDFYQMDLERMKFEEIAINEYIKVYEESGQEAGQKAFFEKLNSVCRT